MNIDLTGQVALITGGTSGIGAATARLLLQSGIMNLNLFDDELLSTENPSRHLLGCSSAGFSKTEELAKRLRSDFPLSNINAYKGWNAYDENGESFKMKIGEDGVQIEAKDDEEVIDINIDSNDNKVEIIEKDGDSTIKKTVTKD